MAVWPYSTTRWKKLRLAKLRATPLCEPCADRGWISRATTVDHKVSVKSGGEPFPHLTELTSMCARCHSVKTSAADRPDRRPGPGLLRGCDVNGMPLDPNHPFLAGRGGGSPNLGAPREGTDAAIELLVSSKEKG